MDILRDSIIGQDYHTFMYFWIVESETNREINQSVCVGGMQACPCCHEPSSFI